MADNEVYPEVKQTVTPTRELLKSKAAYWARTELVKRHHDEYSHLYRFYCDELGVGDNHSTSSSLRPEAPPYESKSR